MQNTEGMKTNKTVSDAYFSQEDYFLFKNTCRTFDEKVSALLWQVGIVPNLKGYIYLRYAVIIAADNSEYVHKITKLLYPAIAKRFDTTATRVERDIRHAITMGTNSGKMSNLNALLGAKLYEQDEKPTNSEFIALVADKMMLENLNIK